MCNNFGINPFGFSNLPRFSFIRFTTHVLDKNVEKVSEGWSKSERILLFEFANYDEHLTLRLIIGPGNDDYRVKLSKFFKKENSTSLFRLAKRKMGKKYFSVYVKEFLKKNDYENKIIDELKVEIERKFLEFKKNDLLKIDNYFQENWTKFN